MKKRRRKRYGPNKRWQGGFTPHTLSERMKVWRIRRGLTQTELAETAGVGKSFVSLLETNRSVPSVETVSHLAQRLGITLDYLVDGRHPAERIAGRHAIELQGLLFKKKPIVEVKRPKRRKNGRK